MKSVTPEKEKEKPTFLSWPWILGIVTAFMFWRYSARDYAVSTVSTINTTAQFTFGSALINWFSTNYPDLTSTLVTAKLTIISVSLGLWDVITNNLV